MHTLEQTTWKGVIGRHKIISANQNDQYLLQFCSSNGLSIMNTFFQHKDVHKYTWYRSSMGQMSLIVFVLFPLISFLACWTFEY